MNLKEILDRCNMLNVHEVRHVTDDYAELVFHNRALDEWNRILSDTLGPPKKPAGVEPSENDLELTKDYGGIRVNQTLFMKEVEDSKVIAMYWPWQNGIHTTLKMAHVRGWNSRGANDCGPQ
jgi:hypothetical protein